MKSCKYLKGALIYDHIKNRLERVSVSTIGYCQVLVVSVKTNHVYVSAAS